MARTKTFDEKEVLKKAMEVFWKKGYNGTSMQDLVEAMGINRASMYATFGDKHQLYLKTLKLYLDSEHQGLEDLQKKSDSPLQTLDALLENIIQEALTDHEQKGCFLVNSTSELLSVDEEIKSLTCQNRDYMLRQFTNLIQKGQEMGEMRTDRKAEDLAAYFFTTMIGLRTDAKANTDPKSLNSSKKIILSTLL